MKSLKTFFLLLFVFGIGLVTQRSFAASSDVQASKDELNHFYDKINDWFSYIDNNLENGLKQEELDKKEADIEKCLNENNLGAYKLNFDHEFQGEFLYSCGLQYQSPSLFYKYSRYKTGKITLNNYWKILFSNFKIFYSLYQKGSTKTNFANVEMPVKVLKLYLHK